ncbi:hypothetical protein OIE62_06160 [Streptomyces scopuliridis]|uniref:Uncharacterized protein n=1 Tax=Streptomyces scopuliridis TaxID=452529 RepID=A0ACD4ZYI9_9ACTN|nr:hypothetical protein [Streptomyces scopuliridis]WSB38986.1 hypothetical protein OG949_33005 [Streptomyces scopuliridis]WSC03434.1 hypothetical protein OG835_35665 [Streptomyces scopuliridis]WSC11270.1 hypothetical protein OIE62_06160 [Streptomyces scopuliridis]
MPCDTIRRLPDVGASTRVRVMPYGSSSSGTKCIKDHYPVDREMADRLASGAKAN